ncbi:MAG: FHA domain-containing protein [Acidimicrobiales bacterium]|nr:FHA domain-containing protein [Acidimicrobiales bacterium]MCB9392892.1 FHA domain-containing protein [Acidimicrobiaceae bacterium]
MTDSVLEILNYALLALLYLFFARVLWAVWSEVRGPRAGHLTAAPPIDATMSAPAPPQVRANKRVKRGQVTRLLVIQPRERKGAAFGIVGELTIGRLATCTICIPDDPFVSATHARLYTIDGVTYVEDLGSTNGSFHNGARLGSVQPFSVGDRLQIGSTVLEGA